MFNLLIVDDERFIAEGLAALDWYKVGINKVYKATSGRAAIEVMNDNKIDIVITDIRMPDMSGLDLIKHVDQALGRKFILLSGHAEFGYAKEGIKLNVIDYLLKPVTDDELYSVVLKAVEIIKQEQQDKESYSELMKTFMDVPKHAGEIKSLHILYDTPQLIHLLDAGHWEEAAKKLDCIFSQLNNKGYHLHEYIMEAYFMIANTFTYYAHKNGQLLIDIIGVNFKEMFRATESNSVAELQDITLEVLNQIKNEIKKEVNHNHTSVIEQVQAYVELHIGSDISLQEVAEHVYLHPAYLSKIYKIETGEGFSDYLYRKKMVSAASLLKTTNKKVHAISVLLGYNDPSYFIKRFKNHYGVTPQEFRNID